MMTNDEINDVEKEKKIITDIVLDSRDEIHAILDNFKKDKDLHSKDNASDEIIQHFVQILYRINRFSEFKSKIRVLKRGEKISKKELERCKLVIKLRQNPNEMSVCKNDYTNVIGIFRK